MSKYILSSIAALLIITTTLLSSPTEKYIIENGTGSELYLTVGNEEYFSDLIHTVPGNNITSLSAQDLQRLRGNWQGKVTHLVIIHSAQGNSVEIPFQYLTKTVHLKEDDFACNNDE